MYRLLLVDDEKQITEGLKYFLPWEKYQISEIRAANTYEEALGLGYRWKPHIAMIDVCIGKYFGYDLQCELRRKLPELHTIMISGYDEFFYVREAMRQRAVDYLLKPINRAELEKVLKEIVVEKLHGSLVREPGEDVWQDEILGMDVRKLSKLIRKILNIVHEEYGKNLNLSVLSERLEMSGGYLGKLFSKETGMKFSQYLMMYRMNVAKELMISTDYKVAYIANKVGYSNLNYFYMHFQACYQRSPLEFREGKTE